MCKVPLQAEVGTFLLLPLWLSVLLVSEVGFSGHPGCAGSRKRAAGGLSLVFVKEGGDSILPRAALGTKGGIYAKASTPCLPPNPANTQ